MAGETDVSICSQALIRLGENTISSLSDESERATICANVWPNLKRSILARYPWKRTMRKRLLNRVTAAPTNEYSYAYTLPPDRLQDVPFEVWDNDTATAATIRDFKIFDGQLLTDAAKVCVDYQVEISEGDFSPHLVELSILALCAEVAIPITDKTTMSDYFRQRAWGTPSEAGQGGYYRIARQVDAAGEPPNVVDEYDLVTSRHQGVRT
jgi:hypothetical protein